MCASFRVHAWRWCITEQSARSSSDCPKPHSAGAAERVQAAIWSPSLYGTSVRPHPPRHTPRRLVVTLSVPSLTCGPGRGGQDGDQGWKLPSSLRRNCTRQAGAALLRTWPRPRGSQAPTRSAPPAPPPRPHQCIQSTVIQHWTSFILLFSVKTV